MIGGTIYNDIFSYINNPSKDTVGIWKFCLKTQKWTKLFDFDYKDVTATLSSNQNYLIIAGGYMKFGQNNKIFVMDLTDETKYKLKQSKITLPKAGPFITCNGC